MGKVAAAERVKIGCVFLPCHISVNSESTLCNCLMFDSALATFSVQFSISARTCYVIFTEERNFLRKKEDLNKHFPIATQVIINRNTSVKFLPAVSDVTKLQGVVMNC